LRMRGTVNSNEDCAECLSDCTPPLVSQAGAEHHSEERIFIFAFLQNPLSTPRYRLYRRPLQWLEACWRRLTHIYHVHIVAPISRLKSQLKESSQKYF
jgi:hypothetical protein